MTGSVKILRRSPWRRNIPPRTAAWMLLAGIAGQLAGIVTGGSAGVALAPVVGLLLMFALAGVLMPEPQNRRKWLGLRPIRKKDLKLLLQGVLLIWIGNGFLTVAWQKILHYFSVSFAPQQNVAGWIQMQELSPLSVGILIFSLVVLTPLFEEIFFRRLLYGLLLPGGPVRAFLLTAGIFSAVHFFLLGIPALFWMGMMFQYLYLENRNLYVPVLAHGIVNLTAVLTALLSC